MTLALRLALREMRAGFRGGLRGFRVFVLCLMLGVAAIAAVGLVREAILRGLDEQGAVLLGGDAEYQLTYRRASDAERTWMADRASQMSEVIRFRSMLGNTAGDDFALTQVKAVDGAYPLTGQLELDPPGATLAAVDGVPGAYLAGILADRLGLKAGDMFTLGGQPFQMRARLTYEPDATGLSVAFGPRTIVPLSAIEGTPFLNEGSLFDAEYRVMLRPGDTLDALKPVAQKHFEGAGVRWADSRRASPSVERFTDQLSAFLVLVGLAGLAVGGVGISAATNAWISTKAGTIATLRAVGATTGLVLAVFGVQIAAVAVLGTALGVALGAGLVLVAAGPIGTALPFPVVIALDPAPLAEAALFGLLTVALFTLWPLGRMTRLRAARLYRPEPDANRPGLLVLVLSGLILAAIVVTAGLTSGRFGLTLGVLGGVAGALVALSFVARGVRGLAGVARGHVRGWPVVHLALASLSSRAGGGRAVLLSLGLGLSVLSAIGQIEAGLRGAISRDVPQVAPAFFLIDILPTDRDTLVAQLQAMPDVTQVQTAPMLRGVITQINGRPAREVGGDHWVLRGDRGVTFADTPREALTQGTWWPQGYDGPPQASFGAKEAAELGLKLNDSITVNILGRDITAKITSFRDVDFSTAGIGFVLTLNPSALAGAPHTDIATVYADPQAESPILRMVAKSFPNVTAIAVREALDRVADALGAISRAVALAASVTLAVGLIVLVGAAAAGEGARAREAALLKTLGTTRGKILASFALRAAITGTAAGILAVAVGAIAAWAVLTQVMDVRYGVALMPAIGIILAGIAATVVSQMVFAIRPLSVRPASVLREAE